MVSKRSSGIALVCLSWLALATYGCSSGGTFHFDADPQINNGLLLTIDLVLVSDSEEQQIRDLGDEWFYSDLRRRLGSRTRTVTLEGGDRKSVTVLPDKGCKECTRLAIIADYQFDKGSQKAQMEFRSKNGWKGQTLKVKVFDRHLEIRRS
ncbi:MAG: hypothetical protein AAF657_20280 [Acidobacteriota bacterium]